MVDTNKTLDEINRVLQQFSDKVEEVRNTPDDVDSAFASAATALAAAEGGAALSWIPFFGIPIGAVAGGVYGAMTEDDLTGIMQNKKEEIKAGIRLILEKLSDAINSLRAPVAFIETAGDWLQLKDKISEAYNNYVLHGNLSGQWIGAASFAYANAAGIQQTAMDSAKSICDTANSALRSIADTAWKFYSGIVEDLADYMTKFTAALAKITTGVAAPFGISDAIDLCADMVTKITKHSTTLGGSLLTQRGILDAMSSATASPPAINGGHWPRSASTDFDTDTANSKWEAR